MRGRVGEKKRAERGRQHNKEKERGMRETDVLLDFHQEHLPISCSSKHETISI